jgi:hypothetical protein
MSTEPHEISSEHNSLIKSYKTQSLTHTPPSRTLEKLCTLPMELYVLVLDDIQEISGYFSNNLIFKMETQCACNAL